MEASGGRESAVAPSTADSRPPLTKDSHFGRAKSCILLFLYGSPSQIELADMKPDAPEEIRGELMPIRSTLPGCDVCELLPHTSRVMHNVTVVRSLTHKYPIHGVAYATTSVPEIDVAMELSPRDGRHWPFIGSVVDFIEVHIFGYHWPDFNVADSCIVIGACLLLLDSLLPHKEAEPSSVAETH